jgi:phenylpyruvate tautomerase PptA (4-oxalocrotonate tautomerase family)
LAERPLGAAVATEVSEKRLRQQLRSCEEPKERTMPHVIVKLYSGRRDKEKSRLAEEITKAVMTTLKYGDESASVGIEDVKPEDWV